MASIETVHPLPSGEMVALMTGKVSETASVVDNFGKKRDVNMIIRGAAMAGVEHLPGNKYGAGMLNHSLIASRISEHIAYELLGRGFANAHPRDVQDGHLVSHNGRLPHDQAREFWAPGPARDKILSMTNEALGIQMLKESNAPANIITLVTALAHGVYIDPGLRDSLDFRIAVYADHIVDQHVLPLADRMATFFLGNFVAAEVRSVQKDEIIAQVRHFVELRKALARMNSKLAPGDVIEELSIPLGELKCMETWNSGRLDVDHLMQFIMDDAAFEVFLESQGIEPTKFTDDNPPMRRWEAYIRRLSIHAAEKEIFEKIRELTVNEPDRSWAEIEQDTSHPLWKEFPPDSWWGRESLKLYRQQNGIVYRSKRGKPSGMKRAVEFFLSVS